MQRKLVSRSAYSRSVNDGFMRILVSATALAGLFVSVCMAPGKYRAYCGTRLTRPQRRDLERPSNLLQPDLHRRNSNAKRSRPSATGGSAGRHTTSVIAYAQLEMPVDRLNRDYHLCCFRVAEDIGECLLNHSQQRALRFIR